MRVYKDKKLTKVVCNNCGKNIKVNNSTIEEGVFFADYKWGYFSKKDAKYPLIEKSVSIRVLTL
jgi:hypothetical protein